MGEEKTSATRRDVLKWAAATGIVVGAAAAFGGYYAAPPKVVEKTVEKTVKPTPKALPTEDLVLGCQAHFRGAAAALSEAQYKGTNLGAEKVSAEGGILGRKIKVIARDEAGTDETVKEYKRLVLEDKIDFYVGLISSGNTPAVGPVAEELGVVTLFVDGCTDFLFDKAVLKPHFVFRVTAINSADGIGAAIKCFMSFPEKLKYAHVHPDYAYGRNVFDHFTVAMHKLNPDVEEVYVGFPPLFETDFTAHLTAALEAKADIFETACWGGDYIALYKQGLGYGVPAKMQWVSNISHGVTPHYIEPDHPEGTVGGVHSNWYFTYPDWDLWPPAGDFVGTYWSRYNEWPNFEAQGGYDGVYAYKLAVERAYNFLGEWPSDDDIIFMLERLGWFGAKGYVQFRPDNHQGYGNFANALTKNLTYGGQTFNAWDLNTVSHIPIEKVCAPPYWPLAEPTRSYDWVEKTWKPGIGI
ncbi:MAG: ABC transporter substrate-binding protein [Candidatus Geothermarchaeales archaeon]